jgi:hypothetical protein
MSKKGGKKGKEGEREGEGGGRGGKRGEGDLHARGGSHAVAQLSLKRPVGSQRERGSCAASLARRA